MRKDILKKEEQIRNWVIANRSKAWIARELSCKSTTLDSYLKKFDIEYKGNRGGKGYNVSPHKKTLAEYIKNPLATSHRIRLKWLEEREHCCDECFREEWNGFPIPLELHHVDGNRKNNEMINMQLLCPNCHAQTDTYCKKKAPMEE